MATASEPARAPPQGRLPPSRAPTPSCQTRLLIEKLRSAQPCTNRMCFKSFENLVVINGVRKMVELGAMAVSVVIRFPRCPDHPRASGPQAVLHAALGRGGLLCPARGPQRSTASSAGAAPRHGSTHTFPVTSALSVSPQTRNI